MKPELSSRNWSKVGGKFNQRRDSGGHWMKTQGQVTCNFTGLRRPEVRPP
jgi:hypothetical protein